MSLSRWYLIILFFQSAPVPVLIWYGLSDTGGAAIGIWPLLGLIALFALTGAILIYISFVMPMLDPDQARTATGPAAGLIPSELKILLRDNKETKHALDRAQEESSQADARYRLLFDANPNALVLCNSKGAIAGVNRETESLFGQSREYLIGKDVDCLIPLNRRKVHKGYIQSFFKDPEKRAMGANWALRDSEQKWDLRGLNSAGEEFPVTVGLTPIHLPEGVHTLAAIVDVTESINSEEEIKRSNKELEQFAYVASHDLKSPLRGVQQLVEWIAEELEGTDNPEIVKYLGLLQNRVERMQNLLNALLDYSRAGRVEDRICDLDSGELVRAISDSVLPINNWKLQTETELPTFRTLNAALSQVFHNLISNAVKHSDRDTGLIRVKHQELDKFYRFEISDDGPGIAPEFHEKIFVMFQTLRPRDDVEGSGMGLALIKKLVDQQGGIIEICSNPSEQRGATFTFTWPKEI